MRIIVLILRNESESEFAIDLHVRWPFITFENLKRDDVDGDEV